MSEHVIDLKWKRATTDFKYETYDRGHEIRFAGGSKLPTTAAKEYMGDPALANPEEMLAAVLSSCHMLTFLAIAAKSKFTLDSYEDHAVATLEKGPDGKMWVTQVKMSPRVIFSGPNAPSAEKIKEMHAKAHANCFIANSVRTSVQIETG